MQFDVFFSISQTPARGLLPDEPTMFANWMEQVEAADRLGYGVAWLAESHLSSEVQKQGSHPVIPHWEGEVGLNCDFLQSSHAIFRATRRIETGSAVMNILQGGGPIAAAERIAFFATLQKLAGDTRRIHVGFSAGRFDYMNRAHGYVPRDDLERAIPYPFLKGKIFHEATEIFCRLLAGETLSSDDVPHRTITEAECRTAEDWERIHAAGEAAGRVEERDGTTHVVLPKRFTFEALKIVPQDWDRSLVQLVAGSHDPAIPKLANQYLPCQVANLSITPPEVIERTHQFMAEIYHPDGGPWTRDMMPRTVMVFLNEEEGLTPEERTAAAQAEAKEALSAYWNALTGTIDPAKIENAADNAVIGNATDVARQISERFHPDDRLMLWFDFFNHDSARVVRDMEAFREKVISALEGLAA
ncbi:MAG: LLM class flavin-dependent oxidoreductase [Thermoplasmatota archaeon]